MTKRNWSSLILFLAIDFKLADRDSIFVETRNLEDTFVSHEDDFVTKYWTLTGNSYSGSYLEIIGNHVAIFKVFFVCGLSNEDCERIHVVVWRKVAYRGNLLHLSKRYNNIIKLFQAGEIVIRGTDVALEFLVIRFEWIALNEGSFKFLFRSRFFRRLPLMVQISIFIAGARILQVKRIICIKGESQYITCGGKFPSTLGFRPTI